MAAALHLKDSCTCTSCWCTPHPYHQYRFFALNHAARTGARRPPRERLGDSSIPRLRPPPPPSSSCPPPSRPFPNCRGCRFCPPPPPLARQGGERNRCNSIIIVITSTTTTTTTATNPPFAPDCVAGQWRPSRFSHSPSAQLHSRIGVSCK